MSDIKLFRLQSEAVYELPGTSVAVEKSLQTLIERHLEALLGVRFLASEYSTGKTHRGRIDTLGIDENNRPVIIEYRRALNQNVINQGLSYLNWLMDHKAELKFLVLDQLGRDAADAIEWGSPRLLCIAGDFTKFDEQAIEQIPSNIELIRYRRYGDALLLFELASATAVAPIDEDGYCHWSETENCVQDDRQAAGSGTDCTPGSVRCSRACYELGRLAGWKVKCSPASRTRRTSVTRSGPSWRRI